MPAVEQWVPIFAQDLEAIGFKTELNGLESTAAIEFYNKIDQWEIIIAQGGDQGVGPFRTQAYYNCDQVEPAVNKAYLKDCEVDELFLQARREVDDAARTEIFKRISKILNVATDRVSLLDDECPERQGQGPRGRQHPAEHPRVHRRGPELDIDEIALLDQRKLIEPAHRLPQDN